MFRILLLIVIFYSCNNYSRTCKNLQYVNGMTYEYDSFYSGTCVTHHKNFNLRSVQSYRKGFDHGKWEFYFEDGILEVEGNFNMGKKVGKWKYYYPSGKIKRIMEYDNDSNLINDLKF